MALGDGHCLGGGIVCGHRVAQVYEESKTKMLIGVGTTVGFGEGIRRFGIDRSSVVLLDRRLMRCEGNMTDTLRRHSSVRLNKVGIPCVAHKIAW